MATAITSHGYLVKKINDTWVILTESKNDKGDIINVQTPLHLLKGDKRLQAWAYPKNDVGVKSYAKEYGFIFVDSYTDLK